MPLLNQSAYILVPVIIAFIWKALDLGDLTVPALGTLVITYIILSRKKGSQTKRCYDYG